MTHWIVGIDSANGEQKLSGAKQKDDGSLQKRKDLSFPSIRSLVDVGTLNTNETIFDYWEWGNFTYSVGDTALEHGLGGVQQIQGQHRYGNENQIMMIAVGLHMLGVRDGDTVDICVLAPPTDAKVAGDEYRAGFDAFDNKLTIRKGTEKKSHTFKITSVTVFMEAIAASIAMQYDDSGKHHKSNPLVNSLMLVDGGRVTLDRIVFKSGKVDKNSIPTATNNKLGIQDIVLNHVVTWGRRELPAIYHNGLDELVDRAIRNRTKNGSGYQYHLYRHGETPINISNPVEQGIAVYEAGVTRYLDTEARTFNVNRLALVGGIEYLLGDYLRARFADHFAFVDLSDYDQMKKVRPNMINAVGSFRYLVRKQSG